MNRKQIYESINNLWHRIITENNIYNISIEYSNTVFYIYDKHKLLIKNKQDIVDYVFKYKQIDSTFCLDGYDYKRLFVPQSFIYRDSYNKKHTIECDYRRFMVKNGNTYILSLLSMSRTTSFSLSFLWVFTYDPIIRTNILKQFTHIEALNYLQFLYNKGVLENG